MSDSGRTSNENLRYNIPRLTYAYLETLIKQEDYHHVPNTGVTMCCLVLVNGYSVTAEAVCANTQLFDVKTGKEQSRRKAIKRLMELEHYLLRQRLYEAVQRERQADGRDTAEVKRDGE